MLSFHGCGNVQTGEYFLTFQTSMWPSFSGLAVEYAIPRRWSQHGSLKVSKSLSVITVEHCRTEFSSGRILVSHSLFFTGLYFVFLQIHVVIKRIKVHHSDPSVVRSIRIVFALYHLISRSCAVCTEERKTLMKYQNIIFWGGQLFTDFCFLQVVFEHLCHEKRGVIVFKTLLMSLLNWCYFPQKVLMATFYNTSAVTVVIQQLIRMFCRI